MLFDSVPVTRLIIFTTHPIQYQIPWFRALAACAGLEIKVVFSYLPDAREQGAGFGTSFLWDIPLLTGYAYEVLDPIRFPRPVPRFAQRWSRGIKAILQQFMPDAAIVLGWQEVSLVQALLACRRRGIPVILRGESNGLKSRPLLITALQRKYFQLCDGFLAIGQANARFYRSSGVSDPRILVAGYCVDNERFKLAAEQLSGERKTIRSNWSIPEKSCCFAFVGKLEKKKRVLDYLEAMRLACQQSSKIAGLVVGCGEQFDEAREFVDKWELPIRFTGFLNQSEISRAYVAADALVLPSDFEETWGLVVNEAMASKIPAIVSDRIGAANDLVINGSTGFVCPFGDTSGIADEIVRLATDSNGRREMGQQAQLLVTADYSIARAVERTVELIEFVLAKRDAFA